VKVKRELVLHKFEVQQHDVVVIPLSDCLSHVFEQPAFVAGPRETVICPFVSVFVFYKDSY